MRTESQGRKEYYAGSIQGMRCVHLWSEQVGANGLRHSGRQHAKIPLNVVACAGRRSWGSKGARARGRVEEQGGRVEGRG